MVLDQEGDCILSKQEKQAIFIGISAVTIVMIIAFAAAYLLFKFIDCLGG